MLSMQPPIVRLNHSHYAGGRANSPESAFPTFRPCCFVCREAHEPGEMGNTLVQLQISFTLATGQSCTGCVKGVGASPFW